MNMGTVQLRKAKFKVGEHLPRLRTGEHSKLAPWA